MRHVALKILYLGWDYQGFAVQEDTNETIEAHMFKALTLTTLIEERQKSNYHRCGRTDKGVSSFCQVIIGRNSLAYISIRHKTKMRCLATIYIGFIH
jgi:tRNA pseudouridine(38-40) synthase